MMATFARTHRTNLNVVVSNVGTPSMLVQYQNIVFELHTWIKLAGWAVVDSCDGVNPPSAADNIASAADIIPAAEGVAHSWIRYSSPTGWVNTGTIEIVLNCTGPAGLSPTDMEMIYAVTFDTAGTLAYRPKTTPASNEVKMANDVIVPESIAAFAPSHAHMGRTVSDGTHSGGDWWFGVSEDGNSGGLQTIIHAFTPDRSQTPEFGGPDHVEYACLFHYAQGNNLVAWGFIDNLLQQPTVYGMFSAAGLPTRSDLTLYSPAQHLDLWTGGISPASSKPHHSSAEFAIDSPAAYTRYLGKLVDFRWTPELLPSNRVEDGDTDDVRYVTLGNVFVPVQQNLTPPNVPPFIV